METPSFFWTFLILAGDRDTTCPVRVTEEGPTVKNRTAKASVVVLALALAIALSPSARAQSFQKVSVKGNAKMMQVASGGASVWALATNGHPYIYKTNKFLQASAISLTQIAVGGGNLRQPDTVWGLDSSGNIYNATKSGTSWVFNQAPGVLSFIAVGIGYQDSCHLYEVWGLNPSAGIYRFNYCIGNWENIPGTLQTLAVGGGEVWGVNGYGEVYNYDFESRAFIKRDLPFPLAGPVAVGPDGAWVVYGTGDLVELIGNDGYLFTGDPVNTYAVINAGGDGVWGLDSAGEIFLLRHSIRWAVQIPGSLATISVGSGAGVWGINPIGQVFAFSTQ